MVLSGQFLERATLIESAGACLEGLSHRGEKRPGLLICPPHPARGSSMDSPVCAEIAFAASQLGHPTLRFNYRGAGASQGLLKDDLAGCADDAAAALQALAQNVGHREIVVAGYDFGAQVAIELANRVGDIKAVAIVAPATEEYDFSALTRLSARGLVVVGELDPASDRLALAELCQSAGDELVVIEEADHVFSRGLSAMGKTIAAFVASAAA
jgi:alpha/beta superfamily hydrolase